MFNKVEVFGIALSVGIMALALFLLRVEDISVASLAPENESQTAIAVVSSDGEEALFNTLADAVDSNGQIQKLVIDDVLLGTGTEAEDGDTVTVHYVGRLENGQEFDNSRITGQPFSFTIGDGRVIQGWEDGLIGMKVGGQRILVIPPELAYGNQNVGPIPANSTLIFSIELLSINE